MNKQEELLVITSEECNELGQACSKVIRFGNPKEYTEYPDFAGKARNGLKEEAGDVWCMLKLLIKEGYLTMNELEEQSEIKLERLRKYSKILND